jgi:hypothetical protein
MAGVFQIRRGWAVGGPARAGDLTERRCGRSGQRGAILTSLPALRARARWGVAADGFFSLFGTKVVLPGIGDMRTLDAVSRRPV